jgi:hypothetical protein
MTDAQALEIIKQLNLIVREFTKLNANIDKLISGKTSGDRQIPPPTLLVDPTKRPGS